jgi:hypothetical protein
VLPRKYGTPSAGAVELFFNVSSNYWRTRHDSNV